MCGTRRLFAEIELDEDIMLSDNSENTPVDYIEDKVGWLSTSGVYLNGIEIADEDDSDEYARYRYYLMEFALDYSLYHEFSSPMSFAEWRRKNV